MNTINEILSKISCESTSTNKLLATAAIVSTIPESKLIQLKNLSIEWKVIRDSFGEVEVCLPVISLSF